MMEVLVTGLDGLVGSRLPELFPNIKFTNLSLLNGYNILKPDTLESIFSTTTAKSVIHAAAFTDTAAAFADRGNLDGPCYQVNVVGTQNIVDQCRRHHLHLIHLSTDSVYDGTKKTPYVESDPRQPLQDWYGETKALGEEVVEKSDLTSTIVRIAYPYRAQYTSKLDFARKVINKLEKGEVCKLFTDQITTPTFIDDIAVGLMKMVKSPRQGIYHLVGSSSQSLYELGLAIADSFSFDRSLIQESFLVDYHHAPGVRPYSKRSVLSNAKFVADYSFTPHNLTSGLAEMKRQLGNS